jgi:hypothetical protein
MDLTACLDEPARRIEMLSHGIVHHGLDHYEGHTLTTKVIQRVLDEPTPDAATLRRLVHGEIRDASLARLTV